MAVIREQRTFRNQPIGVVRASRAGEEYWQTVGRAADELTQTAYRAAADQAKKTGMETAEAVKQSDFRTIDPLTGEIETFNMPSVPQNFGTIARDAFERVAENRYVKSVESAIKEKSAEIALTHQSHPQAVERYEADMGEYLSQVTKNVQPRFQETTRDIAAAWMASTRTNLLAKRFAIQQEIERGNLEADAKTDSANISKLSSMGSPDADIYFKSSSQKQMDAVTAGVQTANQAANNIAVMRRAMKTGLLSSAMSIGATYEDKDEAGNIVQKPMTSSVALLIENSLATQKINEKLPESLRPLVQKIIDDETYSEDREYVDRFANARRSEISQAEGTVKKATKFEQAKNDFRRSVRMSNSESMTRDAADDVIREQAGLPEGTDMTGYYGSPQSIEDPNLNYSVTVMGVTPQGLLNGVERVVNGEPESEAFINTIVNQYLKYSSVPDSDGDFNNRLLKDGGITKEQDAILRSAIAVKNFRGGNIADIIRVTRDTLQDEQRFNSRVLDVFKDVKYGTGNASQRIDSFMSKDLKLGNDYAAKSMIEPLVRHMIASGQSSKAIEAESTKLLNELYKEEKANLVADPFNWDPNKSFYTLGRVFPNEADRQDFQTEVQVAIDKRFSGYVFSAVATGIDETKKVKLVPFPQQQLSTEQPILYMGFVKDKYGDMVPLQDDKGPLIVPSTIIAEKQMKRAEEAQKAAIEAGKASPEAIAKRKREAQAGRLEQMAMPSETE